MAFHFRVLELLIFVLVRTEEWVRSDNVFVYSFLFVDHRGALVHSEYGNRIPSKV